MSNPLADKVADHVLSAVDLQFEDLQPDAAFVANLAAVLAQLKNLQRLLEPFPADPAVQGILKDDVEKTLKAIVDGGPRSDLGKVLAELAVLDDAIGPKIDTWIIGGNATASDKERITTCLGGLIRGARQLLAHRPDVAAILDDLTAIKNLRGGPADAVAYHDFHVLQMAFKDVWLHAFDWSLQKAAEELYTILETDKVESGALPGPLPESADAVQLRELISGLQYRAPDPIPQEVWGAFGTLAVDAWSRLSHDQQFAVLECAKQYGGPNTPHFSLSYGSSAGQIPAWQQAKDTGEAILKAALATPQSTRGRLADLIDTIHKALAEPYAFDVFAPNSYNYGLMFTYRQRWEPGAYQAGDLAATIPLAPGETRKFSKKRVVKTARAVKEIEKSMSSRSMQSSETSRAEYDIMQRATTATNFKMTATGSFNIGIGSIGATSEFGGNQEQISAATKKGLHEATLKAAEEYRLERSMEIDTTSSTETDETSSGEISNPNNEITVTYLFYELQRRYHIREFLYRIRPVILVAQDVPSPEEINEGWLLQYQWILSRALLDDSLRPALTYLNSGFAGDELAVEVKRTHWETQRRLADAMEANARSQLAMRDRLREALVQTTLSKELIPKMPGALKVFTMGVDPTDAATDALEANRHAMETRLGYVEAALADAQEKLKQAASALETATNDYSTALQNQYNRRVAIDQLRLHVKQNILFYMQAIWDQEPVDQRFFRLYKQKVACIQAAPNCAPQVTGTVSSNPRAVILGAAKSRAAKMLNVVEVTNICAPSGGVGGPEHELVEVADLDNPLGYKGNYIIFPLKHTCHLTEYMLSAFIDNYLGLIDPDASDSFVAEDFEARWQATKGDADEQNILRKELIDYLTVARRSTDEIIVPTGQLFIEALPGSHPLLEDFKLLHRAEDVRKVKAEVRHAELENLRLAARLAAGEREDPDIEKKIVVEGNAPLVVDGSG